MEYTDNVENKYESMATLTLPSGKCISDADCRSTDTL